MPTNNDFIGGQVEAFITTIRCGSIWKFVNFEEGKRGKYGHLKTFKCE